MTKVSLELEDNFFIVGLGASAGGLRALEEFFDNMPPDSDMAFVVVQHLSPDFKSLMKELLQRRTHMMVYRIEDGMKLEKKRDKLNNRGDGRVEEVKKKDKGGDPQ